MRSNERPSGFVILHCETPGSLVTGTWYQTAAYCLHCLDCFTCTLRSPCLGWLLEFRPLNRIDSILRKAHKFGYTTEVLKVTDMLQNADNKLFSLMFRSSHCLHTLLPDLKVTDIVLRNSGTSFNLPHCSYKLYKQSFVNRCLFCDCY